MLGVAAFPSLLYAAVLPRASRKPALAAQPERRSRGRRCKFCNESNPRLRQPRSQPRPTRSSPPRQNKRRPGHFWTMRLRKPILLAILIAFFNQLSGINAILYFAPRIFELTGLGAKAALLQSIGIGVTNLVFHFCRPLADRPARPRARFFTSARLATSLRSAWSPGRSLRTIFPSCRFASSPLSPRTPSDREP